MSQQNSGSGNSNIGGNMTTNNNNNNIKNVKPDPFQVLAFDMPHDIKELEKSNKSLEKTIISFKYILSFCILLLFVSNLVLACIFLYQNSKTYAEYDKMRYLNNSLKKTIESLEVSNSSANVRRNSAELAETRRNSPKLAEVD